MAGVPVGCTVLEMVAMADTDRVAPLTVYYDGACPLCAAEIGAYRRCAGADTVAFHDVSASNDPRAAPDLETATALKRFHVRAADGSLVSGAEAFGHLWLALPSWRWLGRVVLTPGILQLAELAYRGFLIVRPAMQRLFSVTAPVRSRP